MSDSGIPCNDARMISCNFSHVTLREKGTLVHTTSVVVWKGKLSLMKTCSTGVPAGTASAESVTTCETSCRGGSGSKRGVICAVEVVLVSCRAGEFAGL